MTLAELYEEYEAQLHRYAMQLTRRDAHWADDLVQDAFMRAMGHLELLELLQPYQRRAWLRRTLKNLFLDEHRASQRRQALVEQLAADAPGVSHISPRVAATNPFDLVPERYRELVQKRYVLGMTSQEIAQELGVPAATVRSRLHLAIKEMRLQKSELD
jgi:RNA polymerase sigma-70 factor (ECF subfamily)